MPTKTNFPTVLLEDVPGLPEGVTSHRPFVLVVDDESTIADTLSEILVRSGYSATPAYDADSALEIALLKPPAMLISDVMLPGTNGIDLAISMRRIFPDCKIILFSGHASTADLLAAAHREGHQFLLLTKPIHPVELLARISNSFAPRGRQTVAAN